MVSPGGLQHRPLLEEPEQGAPTLGGISLACCWHYFFHAQPGIFVFYILGGGEGGCPFLLRCSRSEHLAETSDESCNLPLPFQVHTSLTKPKEQMMRPTQTQPSSMQKGDKTTPKKRKSTSSRAALVSVRCPTVDGYYWPYLNAKETVILEVATSLCLFF